MRTAVRVLALLAVVCGALSAPAPAPSLPLVYGLSSPLQYAAATGYTGPILKPAATTIYTGYSPYPYTYGYGYGYPSYYNVW